MAEQSNIEEIVFECARQYHENYLLKFQEQDLKDAIENYAEVLNLNPNNSDCYYRLASLMYESGQLTLDDTIKQCKKAISLSPNNINAYIYAGYYLEQAHEFLSAEKTFKQAIHLSEIKSARARLILAATLKKKLQTDGFKLSVLVQRAYYLITGCFALALDASSLKMIYKKIRNKFFFKKYQLLGQIIKRFSPDKLIDFYKYAMKKTGNEEYYLKKLAKAYLNNNDVSQALDCYEECFKLNYNDKFSLLQLAKITQTFYPEKTDAIIDYYNLLLELEQGDLSYIYYELGYLYLKKEDRLNAVSAFKLALKNNEDNPYYNEALAYAYVQLGLTDDAIEYYQKAISLNPDRLWTVNVCYSLGLLYQKCKENYDAAIAAFQAGAVLDDTNEDILIALADVYAIQQDFDSAIKIYNDVLNLNPQNYNAYAKLGMIYWNMKYVSEAISSYKKAIEINPEHEISYNNLGVIYLDELCQYDLARSCFEKALKINPNYPYAYYNFARTFEKLKNYNEAAKYYQFAIDLNKVTGGLDEENLQERLYSMFNV